MLVCVRDAKRCDMRAIAALAFVTPAFKDCDDRRKPTEMTLPNAGRIGPLPATR